VWTSKRMRFFTLLPGVQKGFHLFIERKILKRSRTKLRERELVLDIPEGLAFLL